MAQTAIRLLLEQLPDDARAWIGNLPLPARAEIDRLLKETGVENFKAHWREHKADLDELERSFTLKP
ncbi:hypothetical protein [Mesorhizobium dulcispinae]|uniref:hypothetical protein n=1 Tax=Mesorhizobium dulcispinae TaxID=3072316 RepID=UPI002A23E94F|nr:hypothetical protein [Mesorhizobium sp. VK23D]MDX8517200.1 hypothetical protein [Mesorhizobium sp. VK23D]